MPRSKAHRPSPRCRRHLLAGLLVAASLALTSIASARDSVPGQFDYYALSLSWSPTYCGSDAGRDDRQQCGLGRAYRLSELRVCFGKDGSFQPCGINERRQCQAKSLVLPPVRGGSQ